jgi:hypothetical protein
MHLFMQNEISLWKYLCIFVNYNDTGVHVCSVQSRGKLRRSISGGCRKVRSKAQRNFPLQLPVLYVCRVPVDTLSHLVLCVLLTPTCFIRSHYYANRMSQYGHPSECSRYADCRSHCLRLLFLVLLVLLLPPPQPSCFNCIFFYPHFFTYHSHFSPHFLSNLLLRLRFLFFPILKLISPSSFPYLLLLPPSGFPFPLVQAT